MNLTDKEQGLYDKHDDALWPLPTAITIGLLFVVVTWVGYVVCQCAKGLC